MNNEPAFQQWLELPSVKKLLEEIESKSYSPTLNYSKFYLEALTFLEQVFFYEKEIADFLCVVEILKVKTK